MPEIRRRAGRKRRRKDGLLRFARDIKSQSGEDGIIAAIFSALDEAEGTTQTRWCVDVGAWDGMHLSNTYALLVANDESRRWRGVLIEADSTRFGQLEAVHAPLGNVCVHALVSCVADHDQSLSQIVRRAAPPDMNPADMDLISIDVDGPDYWLFKDVLESYWRPRVVVVEFNPTIPHDIVFVQDRDDSIRHGSSLAALDELAAANDYKLAETTTFNAFFVRRDCYDVLCKRGFCHPDDDLEQLHDFSMGTSLYQLYDGTLKLAGCKKLLWHKLALDENKIQHLAKHDRVYPYAPPNPPEIHRPSLNGSSSDRDGGAKKATSSKQRARKRKHKGHPQQKQRRVGERFVDLALLTAACSILAALALSRRRRGLRG